MQEAIEKIIGTRKLPNESWSQFFAHLSKEGRVDQKTVIAILGLLLDEYSKTEK